MRIVFSVVGLLVVVAIVGLLAKKQLQAAQPVLADSSGSAPAVAAPPARAAQRQTEDDVKKALEAGMQRNRDAAEAGK